LTLYNTVVRLSVLVYKILSASHQPSCST